jgi:GNAT superfamily N-acetyltransferase
MKNDIPGNILLIQPPVHHPAFAPPKWLRIAETVASFSDRLFLCDAGLDFFEKVLGDPGRLHRMAAQAEKRFGADAPEDLPEPLRHSVRDGGWTSSKTIEIIDSMPGALRRIRSDSFYIPTILRRDMEFLDSALALASLAWYPCRFHRDGFSHRGLNSLQDVIDLSHDQRSNPFWQYANTLWQPFSESAAPDVALMCITSCGQVLAAATLAFAWRRRWPEQCIRIVATEDCTQNLEGLLSVNRDRSGVSALADRIVHRIRTSRLWPDAVREEKATYHGAYLSPKVRSRDVPFTIHDHEKRMSAATATEKFHATIEGARQAGHSLIVWRGHLEDNIDALTQSLYAASRNGIWNHVILTSQTGDALIRFAKTNPNIIHSWCRRHPPQSMFSDSFDRLPEMAAAYGDTQPLPGQPVWQALRDPIYIEAYVRHYGLKPVTRMRLIDDFDGHYQVGSGLTYRFLAPSDLPEGYLDQIVAMVAAGGSVDLNFVRYNLERAHLIAYAEEQGVLIGNSSLKHPRREYTDAVSKQIGLDLTGYLERGYTSVRPEYRGLGVGAKLLEGLTQRASDHKIFSVIAEGNTATQKMAIRNRTRRVATFFSQRTQKKIGIWIPEWMIPEDIELPPQPEINQ